MTIVPILAAAAAINANTATTLALSASVRRSYGYNHNHQRDDRLERVLAEDRKEDLDMMAEGVAARKYTAAEISEMRGHVTYLNTHNGVSYYPAERDAKIERELRTYIMAGAEPSELADKVKAKSEAETLRWEQEQQWHDQERKWAEERRAKGNVTPAQKAQEAQAKSWTGVDATDDRVSGNRMVGSWVVFLAILALSALGYLVFLSAST